MTEHELLLRPLLALVAGGLVGLERSFHGRAAGLRTYALVSFASALLVGIARVADRRTADAVMTNVARVIQGIVTGIGFLGAGVIVKEGFTVRGLTTAASVWVVSAIGVAFGAGFLLEGRGRGRPDAGRIVVAAHRRGPAARSTVRALPHRVSSPRIARRGVAARIRQASTAL